MESSEAVRNAARSKAALSFDAKNTAALDSSLATLPINTTAQQAAVSAAQRQSYQAFVLGQEAKQQNATARYFTARAVNTPGLSAAGAAAFDAAVQQKALAAGASSEKALDRLDAPAGPPPLTWAQFMALNPGTPPGPPPSSLVARTVSVLDLGSPGGRLADIAIALAAFLLLLCVAAGRKVAPRLDPHRL